MGLVRQGRRRGSSRGVWLVGAPRNPGSRQTDRRSRATRADGVVRAGRAQRDTGTAPAQIQADAGAILKLRRNLKLIGNTEWQTLKVVSRHVIAHRSKTTRVSGEELA